MNGYYEVNIVGVKRMLPICKLNDDISIAAFNIFGDVAITEHAARCLKAKFSNILGLAEFDIIVVPEAKAIPLAYEMSKLSGCKYIVARKKKKAYMQNVLEVDDKSITTEGVQKLYLDGDDVRRIKDRHVLIVDDVVSTGGSMNATEHLVREAGAFKISKCAILSEGSGRNRTDVITLGHIPIFDSEGNPLE